MVALRSVGAAVRTGLAEGVVLIEGDFDVIGGSMGLVHGEKVVRALDRATEMRLPVVMVGAIAAYGFIVWFLQLAFFGPPS